MVIDKRTTLRAAQAPLETLQKARSEMKEDQIDIAGESFIKTKKKGTIFNVLRAFRFGEGNVCRMVFVSSGHIIYL